MLASLDDLLTTTARNGAFVGGVPEGWEQGRTAFGGLLVGMMVRTAEREAGGPTHVVRAVSADLMAAVAPGEVELTTSWLRVGNSVSTMQVMLRQGGALAAHAAVTFGAPRPGTPAVSQPDLPPPPPWREVPAVPSMSPPGPVFTQHFEYRNVGAWPFSGHATPDLEGWVRPRVPCRVRDAAWLAALVDTYWPPTAVTFDRPRPVATVGYHLDLVADAAVVGDDEPVYQRATAVVGRDGYVSEDRDLWSASGTLLARNRQMLVIIK